MLVKIDADIEEDGLKFMLVGNAKKKREGWYRVESKLDVDS